jgi:hypothetical protein
MESMAQPEHVPGEADADLVGGVPGDDGGHPGDGHVDQLCGHRKDQEQQRQPGQVARVRAGRGGVDDPAYDERPRQDRDRRCGNQRAEAGPTPCVGP